MLLLDAIRIRFNVLLKEKNIESLWELYKITGVPKSTINALFSAETNSLPRLPTLLFKSSPYIICNSHIIHPCCIYF